MTRLSVTERRGFCAVALTPQSAQAAVGAALAAFENEGRRV
jgi:hypothetical protein